jgi:regulator of extracellular matrix RemA (YlzA/DUF370 family)
MVGLEKILSTKGPKRIIAVARSLQILVQATYTFIAHTMIVSDPHAMYFFLACYQQYALLLHHFHARVARVTRG